MIYATIKHHEIKNNFFNGINISYQGMHPVTNQIVFQRMLHIIGLVNTLSSINKLHYLLNLVTFNIYHLNSQALKMTQH